MARPSKASSSVSTPATHALTKLGITFVTRSYHHDPRVSDFGGEAAKALGVEARRVFKTLLADIDGTPHVGIVPVSGMLDLKAFAATVGGRKALMTAPAVAERRTGYVVGGISPIGQRTMLTTVLDESAFDFETILVSGGRRGLDLELAPADLVRATNATVGTIRRD
ncbi:MAG: Cys-tRNA(Pro) deacylase [Microbacteriaceae bacterium]|nr:Cys-tRNA(Pro) deacylase [Microbacteriaceae bacterium]